MSDFLRNALILDIETTGLSLDSKIHQISYLDLDTNLAEELLIQNDEWGDVLRRQYSLGPETGGPLTPEELLKLKENAPGIYEMYSAQPAFSPDTALSVSEMNETISGLGHPTKVSSSVEVALQEALNVILPEKIENKVIWIQNAAFEARMLQEAGLEKAKDGGLYVTGDEVNAARKTARRTGDWRPVWESYQKYTGPGDVRDIMDVLRAHHSYAKKLGLTSLDKPEALSMEIVYRLQQNLLQGETHRAVLDVAVHEASVLRTVVAEIEQMQRGEKPEGVRRYYARQEHLKPELQRYSAAKRLLRAEQDIRDTGVSRQYSYSEMTPSGGRRPVYKTFTSIEAVADFIAPRYPEVNTRELLEETVDPLARLVSSVEALPVIPLKKSVLPKVAAGVVGAVLLTTLLRGGDSYKDSSVTKDYYSFYQKGIEEGRYEKPVERVKAPMGAPITPDIPGAVEDSEGYYWAELDDILVEDADTLLVNGNVSIRLAGIDAPEIAHEDRPAQPLAYEATRVLQELLDNADKIQVRYNPADVTYGRIVGNIYADGRSVNTELLRRGAVVALPFRNGKEPLIPHSAVKKYEKRAFDSNLGIWREPFFQEYRKGPRKTLNQMAKMQREVSSQMFENPNNRVY